MGTTTITRTIAAPPDRVFTTVAHVDEFAKALPNVTGVEFLTDVRSGVGTRFRETRVMRGREGTTELEVTEYVPNESIRLVSDAGGTIWDTVFTVAADGSSTRLTMVMEARPYKTLARLINPLISRAVTKAIEHDMDAVKAYCEAG